MKSFALSVLAMMALMGAVSTLRSGDDKPQPPSSKVALVDMARVFKSYNRLKDQRDKLKDEFAANEMLARTLSREAASLKLQRDEAKKAKDFDKADELERKMTRADDELEKFRRDAQKSMLRKESEIYRETYVEVSEAVKKLCLERQVGIALRFSGNEPAPDPTDSQAILTWMNRQVVYYDDALDLTDEVIKRLNPDQPTDDSGG
jgi:Skp family chaperone for outer membrane proteins